MKSQRSVRSITSHFKPRHSNSPTLTSTYSEKQCWNRSFKNEPFPKELKRRLVGHKFKFSDFSDEEQDNSGIVLEEEQVEVLKKRKVLPHVTIMSDRGEFYDSRSRIKSERKVRRGYSREKSVESLKLPQVMEEKKEEDELQRLERARFSEVKDRNQFNQRNSKHSQNFSASQHSRGNDSHEPNVFTSALPEEIAENEAEETKSEKLKRESKSMISSQLEKIIVDEVDDKKQKKEENYQQISQIIEEERQQEQTENINQLRMTLEKLEHENQFLNKFKEEELIVTSHQSRRSSKSKKERDNINQVIKEE